MPNFNLNSPGDFARLTAGTFNSIVQNFAGGRDLSKWDIVESSYIANANLGTFAVDQNGNLTPSKAVVFHVFQSSQPYNAAVKTVTDQMGRRKVKYMFPYKDGQTTDDLGRRPSSFEFDVLIFGNNYLNALNRLLTELNNPSAGTLTHPVFGDIGCVCEEIELTHSNEARKAVALRLKFIEHNFTIQSFADITKKDTSTKGALTKLASAFAKFENLVNAVEANINAARTVKNQIKQAIGDFQDQFGSTASSMNATFNGPNASDIPALLPVNQGGLQNTSGGLNSGVTASVISPSDPFAAIPIADLSAATAIALATGDIIKKIQGLRDQVTAIINSLKAIRDGGNNFHDNILDLKVTMIDMQDALEKGISSSQAKIIQYVTPNDMTIREVAFANGVDVNTADQIFLLNNQLDSVNYIPKGTSLNVAVGT